jgi:hypothetical protein
VALYENDKNVKREMIEVSSEEEKTHQRGWDRRLLLGLLCQSLLRENSSFQIACHATDKDGTVRHLFCLLRSGHYGPLGSN